MILNNIPLNILGGYYRPEIDILSWRTLFVMLILTLLIGLVLHLFSNIIIKSIPSLSNSKVMKDVHYEASYNQRYSSKNSIIQQLRTISIWKVLAIILIALFIFNNYHKIAFNEWF